MTKTKMITKMVTGLDGIGSITLTNHSQEQQLITE